MPKLPSLTGGAVISALQKLGFQVVRQRGSHVRLEHEDGRVVTMGASHFFSQYPRRVSLYEQSLPSQAKKEFQPAKAGFVCLAPGLQPVGIWKTGMLPVTIPVHAGKTIGRGLLRKILRDIQLSRDDFIALLE